MRRFLRRIIFIKSMELKYVKGLSEKRIAELNKIRINNTDDLVKHFPRNYLDLTHVIPLKYAIPCEYAFTKARLVSAPKVFVSARKLKCVKVVCEQDGEVFEAIWFNQPYVVSKLTPDTEYFFYGRVQKKFGQVSLTNPTFEPVEKNDRLKGILPVYTVTPSIFQRTMQSIILDALRKTKIKSVIPETFIKEYNLESLEKSYFEVHSPSSFDNKDISSDRIATEEYFMLISAFRIIKGDKTQVRLNKYTTEPDRVTSFSKRFGFDFTDGQKRAINEIFSDMNSPHVMNRLIQGDVGCGKTAVALCAIFNAVDSGHQVAFLAPTEVLAEQNFRLAEKFLPEYKVVFLSGSLSVKEKNAVKKAIASGEADIVVGTHAIIQKNVEFKDLSLCVCDEQHRFGVAQRSSLLAKGNTPDLLVMSATPIPRTLSLIFYGDLDITTITEKPKARAKIGTNIVPQVKYDGMFGFISGEIAKGHKIYFVAPKIEDDPEGEVMSVTALYDELTERLPQAHVSLLHGKMKDNEKREIMDNFKNGFSNVLVSTTVIEVGIDVPDATVMVIYDADRFGLSQLHQLRGRVGRSDLQSYCFLLTSTDNPDSIMRLKTLCSSDDGFKIAEADFKTRGGGDIMGTRQSGRTSSILGALKYSPSALFVAKKISDECFERHMFTDELKKEAMKKYDALCDISLN